MVGEVSAFRRGVIERLNEKAVAEDFEMSIRIRKKGYKVIHEPSAVVWELGASSLRDAVTQKKRRAIGTIQTLFQHKDVILNPKYGLYGVYILPSHKLLQMISPFLLLVLAVSSFSYYFLIGGKLLCLLIILELLLLVLGSVSILAAKFNWEIRNTIIAGIGYFLFAQLIVLFAWLDYLRGNYKVTWKKIKSSRR